MRTSQEWKDLEHVAHGLVLGVIAGTTWDVLLWLIVPAGVLLQIAASLKAERVRKRELAEKTEDVLLHGEGP